MGGACPRWASVIYVKLTYGDVVLIDAAASLTATAAATPDAAVVAARRVRVPQPAGSRCGSLGAAERSRRAPATTIARITQPLPRAESWPPPDGDRPGPRRAATAKAVDDEAAARAMCVAYCACCWNSSIGLPEGSSISTWSPPTPLMISLRRLTPAERSRSNSPCRSETCN